MIYWIIQKYYFYKNLAKENETLRQRLIQINLRLLKYDKILSIYISR
jgi:hypothetical protein